MGGETTLLSALLQNPNEYLARDPMYRAGIGIMQQPIAAPQNNTQAFLLPFLQGLGGGTIAGLGRGIAEDKLRKDNLATSQALLGSDYQLPESWTPENAQSSLAAAVMNHQNEQDRAIEAMKQQGELSKALLGQGLVLDPTSGTVSVNPEYINVKKQVAQAEQDAKQKDVLSKLPPVMTQELAKSKSVIDEAQSIADRLDAAGPSWTDLQTAKAFSGADKNGIGLAIKNLADKLARARTGAAINTSEQKLYNDLVGGDLTASPKQVANLMRKLAEAEARNAQSQLGFVDTMQNQGIAGLQGAFKSVGSASLQPTTGPSSSNIQAQIAQLKAQGVSKEQAKKILGF